MEQEIKLSVLQELFNNKRKYIVETRNGHQGINSNDYDGRQGEYNEFFKIYRHPEMPENLFMRETYNTDSYGDNESLINVDFVKGVEKVVTVFESLK